MLTSAISTNTSTNSYAAPVSQALVKTANGEYTADSVAGNPGLAGGLIKLKDGNYAYPIVAITDRAGGIDALISLKHGG